jgi:hypothetical protein
VSETDNGFGFIKGSFVNFQFDMFSCIVMTTDFKAMSKSITKCNNYFLLHSVQSLSEAQSTSYTMDTLAFSLGLNLPGRES